MISSSSIQRNACIDKFGIGLLGEACESEDALSAMYSQIMPSHLP